MWIVTRRVRFRKNDLFTGAFTERGDTPLGLDGGGGMRLILGPKKDWVGCFDTVKNRLVWAAGPKTRARGPVYIPADLKRPSWMTPLGRGKYLVCNAGRGRISVLDLELGFHDLIDLKPLHISSPAACATDGAGNIWVNDIHRPALWVFMESGKLLRILGDPEAPPSAGSGYLSRPAGMAGSKEQDAVPAFLRLEEPRLGPVWDIRCGGDGLLYVLEGSMLRLRAIDFQRGTISLVAGSGMHGFTGDGGDPRNAAFGRSGKNDGPWAFCLDRRGRLFIADTQNGAIRMIDEERSCITTIAGRRAPDNSGGPADLDDQRPAGADGLARPGMGFAGRPVPYDPLGIRLPSVFWLDWSDRGLSMSDLNGEVTVISEP
jgi:hypothetical protein